MIKGIVKFWGSILIAVLSAQLVNYIYLNLIVTGFMYFFQSLMQLDTSFSLWDNINAYGRFAFVVLLLLWLCTCIVFWGIYLLNGMIEVKKFVAIPITIYLLYKIIGVFYILFVGFANGLSSQLGHSFIFYTWSIITFLVILGIYFCGIIGGITKWCEE